MQQQIRNQERTKELRQQQELKPDVREQSQKLLETTQQTSETIPENETPCFAINKIVLRLAEHQAKPTQSNGANRFQFALDETLSVGDQSKPIVGRCLGVQGINALMARVQNKLVAKGYVTTRVLATPQDLNTGTLELTVVPGVINKIRLSADSNPHVSLWNALPMGAGDVLNLRDIEQALENFKRVPTAEADIQIEPAQPSDGVVSPGASDVVIKYQRRFPARIALNVDDSGSRTTGKYQGGITLSLDSVTTLNDLFYINYNHDLGGGDSGKRGNDSTTVHYSIPWDYWLFSSTFTNSDFHQEVAGINQNFIFRGESQNAEIKLSRMVFRNAINKTQVSVGGFFRKSNNYIDDVEIEVQRRRTAGWTLGFNQLWYLGQSTLDYTLQYKRGTGAEDSLKAPEEPFGEGTSRMEVLTADVDLSLPFGIKVPWGMQALQYSARLHAQQNYTPLTPQDRISIGNRYTVRGFDGEQVLLGDSGFYLRNELQIPIAKSGQALYWGLDYGEVHGQSTHQLLGKNLAGTVIGLRGGVPTPIGGFNYDIFFGTPLHKPRGYQTKDEVAGFSLNYAY